MKENKDLELWLVWKDPVSRQRFVCGKLWYDRLYKFRYLFSNESCAKTVNNCGVDIAEKAGFTYLEPFKDLSGVYSSEGLFHIFARRLPDRTRPDFKTLVKEYDLDFDCTQLELLEATGGRLATDTLEFATPFVLQKTGDFDIEFYVAGWRYYDGEKVIDQLFPGSKVDLQLEPDNPYDPFAIQIYGPERTLLGYVPVYYTRYLDETVNNNTYEAFVKKIGPADDPQLRLRVNVKGKVALLAEVDRRINLRAANKKRKVI